MGICGCVFIEQAVGQVPLRSPRLVTPAEPERENTVPLHAAQASALSNMIILFWGECLCTDIWFKEMLNQKNNLR